MVIDKRGRAAGAHALSACNVEGNLDLNFSAVNSSHNVQPWKNGELARTGCLYGVPAGQALSTYSLQGANKDSKQPESEESMGSASEKERSAEAQPSKQPLKADQFMSDPEEPAPNSFPAPSTPAQSSEAAASSRTASLSPQSLLHLPTRTSNGQAKKNLPGPAALAAQKDEPWRSVLPGASRSVSRLPQILAGAKHRSKAGVPLIRMLLLCHCHIQGHRRQLLSTQPRLPVSLMSSQRGVHHHSRFLQLLKS